HAECTAMSCKYLGQPFDIHGGGMDLLFPHHESEIAQSVAAYGEEPCRYWVHNNMITINGQKMGKSLGNFITLEQLFTGDHEALEQAYSPMTVRFFILQAHYRGTLDFSNEALQSAEKGWQRLQQARQTLDRLSAQPTSTVADFLQAMADKCREAMDDDLNTPMVLAQFFELVRLINQAADGKAAFTQADLENARNLYAVYIEEILGLKVEDGSSGDATADRTDGLVKMLLDVRAQAKAAKDFATSDKIRDELKAVGIKVLDGKDGATWQYE
ncbi:MAG: cysteine--tRNA ligase, partial [Bacteroidales bacterium]|nr:cysteine--tRNA ligase [Bacteroidales bacterium]